MLYAEYVNKFKIAGFNVHRRMGAPVNISECNESGQRAFDLFVESLDENQSTEFFESGRFCIKGSRGGTYEMVCLEKPYGNVLCLGSVVSKRTGYSQKRLPMCFIAAVAGESFAPIPIFDYFYLQKFMLEHFEGDVLEIAHY